MIQCLNSINWTSVKLKNRDCLFGNIIKISLLLKYNFNDSLLKHSLTKKSSKLTHNFITHKSHDLIIR